MCGLCVPSPWPGDTLECSVYFLHVVSYNPMHGYTRCVNIVAFLCLCYICTKLLFFLATYAMYTSCILVTMVTRQLASQATCTSPCSISVVYNVVGYQACLTTITYCMWGVGKGRQAKAYLFNDLPHPLICE